MGLFSRKGKDSDRASGQDADAGGMSDRAGGGSNGADDGLMALEPFEGRPIASALTDAETARIAAGLRRLEERGVDIDDLDSISAGFDAARTRWLADPVSEGADVVVETTGIAIGEYLTRHSAREWAVVTDVFGTDLGLVSARADTVVVPHNLVGARWMRGDTGWVPGVVQHLVRIAPRR